MRRPMAVMRRQIRVAEAADRESPPTGLAPFAAGYTVRQTAAIMASLVAGQAAAQTAGQIVRHMARQTARYMVRQMAVYVEV